MGGEVIERIGLETIDDIRMGMGCMSNIVQSGVDPLSSLHIRGEYFIMNLKGLRIMLIIETS